METTALSISYVTSRLHPPAVCGIPVPLLQLFLVKGVALAGAAWAEWGPKEWCWSRYIPGASTRTGPANVPKLPQLWLLTLSVSAAVTTVMSVCLVGDGDTAETSGDTMLDLPVPRCFMCVSLSCSGTMHSLGPGPAKGLFFYILQCSQQSARL